MEAATIAEETGDAVVETKDVAEEEEVEAAGLTGKEFNFLKKIQA